MKRSSSRPAGAKAPARSVSIVFRLAKEFDDVLSARADLVGISHHELARAYVMQGLSQARDLESLYEGLGELHGQVAELRGAHAAGVEALLSCAGKVTEDRARTWVDKNLRR